MLHPIILLSFLYFRSAYCQNEDLSVNIVLDEHANNITKLCKDKKCIPKCCDKNEIMDNNFSCLWIADKTDQEALDRYLGNISLYDNYYHNKILNKKLSDVFFLVPRKFDNKIIYKNETKNFTDVAFVGIDYGYIDYLSEGGSLYLEIPNSYLKWLAVDSSNFCVDVDITTMSAQFVYILEVNSTQENEIYYPCALIISSVFLFLVLLVYTVLPELRNLAGLVLMAYVLSLLIAFISLSWLILGQFNDQGCIIMTGFTYFFFMSSFCWMSVMSYDIWWTFRSYAKARKINRRGETFKFRIYCIYAWGVPMMMTIGLLIINNMDLSHMSWFIKPKIPELGCFLVDGQQFVYFYIPILILLIGNWFFFLMTTFNIWRLVRGTAILNSVHHSQKNRFVVYMKLSVIMGINWLLEVLSFLTPQLPIWLYTDTYNLLIGFFIFLIVVWKKEIYRKLKARVITRPYTKKKINHSASRIQNTNTIQQL